VRGLLQVVALCIAIGVVLYGAVSLYGFIVNSSRFVSCDAQRNCRLF
jgi:hypothetical protein